MVIIEYSRIAVTHMTVFSLAISHITSNQQHNNLLTVTHIHSCTFNLKRRLYHSFNTTSKKDKKCTFIAVRDMGDQRPLHWHG